jgi:CheY-like chemotaxis protein
MASTERTILVVEDEAGLRALIEEILGSAGYNVLMAPDGATAVRLSEELPSNIDLLLTDLTLPGMSGQETAARLKAIRPQMEVLFMSGFAESDIYGSGAPGSRMVGSGGPVEQAAFISKPWTARGLCEKIGAVLNTGVAALRVLVVDDDEGMRGWLTEVLQGEGHRVFAAPDGLEAVRLAKRQSFDLVITDISMPNEDGLGTVRALRKTQSKLKIIAISGGNSDALVDAKLLGAAAALAKPFTAEALLSCIRGLMA